MRRFRGFAVIDRPDGSLIWGTFRPVPAEAWAAYSRCNPSVDGYPPYACLVEVEMTIKPVATP